LEAPRCSLRDRFYAELVEPGFRAAAKLVGGRSATGDPEAIAVILVGGLVDYVRSQWTFGAVPLGVSEERLVDALAWLEASVLTGR
jgi:hypothetical protein